MYSSKITAVTLTGGAQKLVGRSSKRKRIVFSPPNANNYWLANDSAVAAGNNGYVVLSGVGMISFDVDQHGSCVQDEWWAIPAAGGLTMGFVEVIG
jgi:hypothetical protein